MKEFKHDLFRQLLTIGILAFGIILIILGLILPKVLLPIYEKNIYNFLEYPLETIDYQFQDNQDYDEIVYLLYDGQDLFVSENYQEIIDLEPNDIITEIDGEYGKFTHQRKVYYYQTTQENEVLKIVLTDNRYVDLIQSDVVAIILPVLLLTFIIVLVLVISWSRRLVLKVYYLKDKVADINRDDYLEKYPDESHLDDELNALSKAIDEMHITLKAQEEYKNQMYQSISHDFKTPLTVIKSYIEAIEDGVLSKEEGLQIIQEQIIKLENKVYSLLYLNKLNYLKEKNNYVSEEVELVSIIEGAIEKFRFENKTIKWELKAKEREIFPGNYDMWEAIIDNMLNNFMRYTEQKIRITVRKNEILFYNDGPNIETTVLHDLFTPYKKGIEGNFGLGLSIIQKSLELMNYEISVNNEKKGVTFKIFPNTEKES